MEWWLIADMSGVMSTLWMIFSVAAGLGLVIFVHELGHFVAAKACGVKCEKFYIGFDIPIKIGPVALPSTLCKFRWGETEYGVGILPLGGYVKMLGQDDNPKRQAEENERVKVRKQDAETPDESAIATSVNSTGAGPEDDVGNDAAKEAEKNSGDQEEEFELDPRSYPARPVWQRMIIISAGVIMNMVFAVVFAAIAYRMGVSYTPCIIGGTAPGSPAWAYGLNPEDKFIQIGRNSERDEQLRHFKDLLPNIMLNDDEQTMDFLIRRRGESSPGWVSLRPTDRLKKVTKRATVGVSPPYTTMLSESEPVDTYRFDDQRHKQFKGGDEVVAVDGVRLPRDTQTGKIFGHHLRAALARHMTEPLTLTVLRRNKDKGADDGEASTEEVDVTLPPTKMRVLGLSMSAGPIVAVRKGTPADEASFRPGDVITSVDGEDVGNLMTLPQRLLAFVGNEIEVGVNREGVDEPVILRVTPQTPPTFDRFGLASLVSLESLGVAFPVGNKARAVEPDSPADKAGLKPGDEIIGGQFVLTDEKKREEAKEIFGKSFDEAFELAEDKHNWHYVHTTLQVSVPGTALKLTYRRDGAKRETTLTPVESDEWFFADRGLRLTLASQVRTAESWGEAFRLGVRETKETLMQVLAVLKRLTTGKISLTQLGGPIKIAAVAGAEASEGIPRLLIFLTFLSANLAVLNFLPIPALDGGHMIFLAAEGIRGKPVNERLQIALTLIGVGCLLSLMLFVLVMDIDWLRRL